MTTPDFDDDELPPCIGTRFRDMGLNHLERYPPDTCSREPQNTPTATGTDTAGKHHDH